jgi:hypothetical protein
MAKRIKLRMSIAQVRELRMFRERTVKERLWLETYVENGRDRIHATQTSYACSSDRSAKILSYEIEKRLRPILDLIFGSDEQLIRAARKTRR